MRIGPALLTTLAVAAVPALTAPVEPAAAGDLLGPEGVVLKAEPKPLTAKDVTSILFKAKPGEKVSFAGRTLRDLDLSNLDFTGVDLAGADLFGADFTAANLSGANLAGGKLNRVTVIRADFSGANLAGAELMRPNVSTSLDYDISEAPRFSGADLRGVRMTAKLVGASFRGANLSQANLGPHEPRADISSMPNSVFRSCDFSGAIMRDIDMNRAILSFSRFVGADLTRATLTLADLSRADLSGADLTGADLTEANFDGAILRGVKGLETVRGLDTIRNLDTAIR